MNGKGNLNGVTIVETPSKNGKGTHQTPTTEKPAAEQAAEILATKPTTIEQQHERMIVLNALFAKEDKLKASKRKLNEFKLSSDENGHGLVLSDKKGAEFTTGNPLVMKEVLTLMSKTIDEALTQVQAEILAA